ncbi:MAG: hypothetical protein AB1529_01590 [Candidatus Micrarchaeota archaeon]
MRALAFRAEKAAAAAVFAANLSSCVTALEKPASPLVITIPHGADASPLVEIPVARKAAPLKATVLSYSQYGPLVEARLSVIGPDNSLERIILDPKVTFYYLHPAVTGASGEWTAIPGCRNVPECVIPAPLTREDLAVMIDFMPGRGSALKSSKVEFVLEAGSFAPLP